MLKTLSDSKLDFFNFTFEELSDLMLEKYSEPAYRARQLFEWVYKKSVFDPLKMTNITKPLREKFARDFVFPKARVEKRQVSIDGSRKYLLELENSDLIEAVMIKQPGRMTLCVSSQVGCGMGCKFCRTATMGFQRNLSASEIIRQVLAVVEDAENFGDMFSNIVFMGMGEPLHNFKSVLSALRILTHAYAFKIGPRKITVSTVGLVPAIKKFAEAGMPASLAVSLNATTDEVRSQIMPINKAYPLEELLSTLKAVPLKKRSRITIEYVMLSGINDTGSDLTRLNKILKGVPVKINLIPYNENAGLGYKQPSLENIKNWQEKLTNSGYSTTIRWSKGRDIDAACGQLATNHQLASNNQLAV
jgi:23S rRNA (adenine2503-C2)-methyltransferase